MSKVDRRSLLGSDEKEEIQTPEPTTVDDDVQEDQPPPKTEAVQPLSIEYMKNVATQWPLTPQGRALSKTLPQSLVDMLANQSDDFLHGFANGVQVIHDLCIKVLLDELRGRLMQLQMEHGVATVDHFMSPQDKLVTVVTTQVEGLGYMACRELVERVKEGRQKK